MRRSQIFVCGIFAAMLALAFTASCDNDPEPTHTHTWGAWQYNAAQHWRECTANDGAKTDEGSHTGNPCAQCGYTPAAASHTVTFDADNGTPATTQTVPHGEAVTEPAPPAKTGYKCIFEGWYDQSQTTPHTFSAPITADITLYAKWRPYELGETAPGGGKIFHRAETGFTQYQHADDNIGTTCHYLEAAPEDMETKLAWSLWRYEGDTLTMPIINTYDETAIGKGKKNTALILAADPTAPAAKACNDYSHNSKTDWFLPSYDELNLLYTNRANVGNLTGDKYWTSCGASSYIHQIIEIVFPDGSVLHQDNLCYVRAIRAF